MIRHRFSLASLLLAVGALVLAGCNAQPQPASQPPATADQSVSATPASEPASELPPAADSMTLATTTSARDSGLLDVLLPLFEQKTAIQVKVVAVGSGQAIELARRGDADVLLAHSPAAEEKFFAEGFAESRNKVMHNDFIIVGPAADPAGLRGLEAAKSLQQLKERAAETKSVFISRGDKSGTHQMELKLWKESNLEPQGAWYLEAGQGMAATLRMAHEKSGYTLTDRATYLSLKKELELAVLVEGDPAFKNVYSVLVVSPSKHPHTKVVQARKFAAFLLSPSCQKQIADFGRDRFGQQVFFPASTTN